MRELPQRHRPLLEGLSVVVATADRVLISGLVHSLAGVGYLVGAASTEAEALACLSSLVQQAGFAARERTTALATITEANALCLIETKQMKPAQAQDIANGFLLSKGVSDTDRDEVKTAPGYIDLMRRYIDEEGGCQDLVGKLR